jgi:hypothetical protein
MGGLRESVGTFRKHHREVADALLNLSGVDTPTGGPVDKDEIRQPYVHQDWPMMVYHANGDERIVRNKQELKEALDENFRKDPYPRPQIAVLDPATEKKMVQDENRELRAQLARQAETQEKLLARLEALEKGK